MSTPDHAAGEENHGAQQLVVSRKRRDGNEERHFVYQEHHLLYGERLGGYRSSHLLDPAHLALYFLHHFLDGGPSNTAPAP